jgi:hypothetical protein
MDKNRIICIFCGKQADIVNEDDLSIVACSHCKRKTELDDYQEMFDQWIGDIRKEA